MGPTRAAAQQGLLGALIAEGATTYFLIGAVPLSFGSSSSRQLRGAVPLCVMLPSQTRMPAL